MTATLEELRDLSRRSRRAQRAGFLALLLALVLFPAQLVLATWLGTTVAAVLALALGGAAFLRYAYLAGQERGAFRRVFRRLANERLTRTLVPTDAQKDARTAAHADTSAPAQAR